MALSDWCEMKNLLVATWWKDSLQICNYTYFYATFKRRHCFVYSLQINWLHV